MRILYVEDERDLATAVQQNLCREGFAVDLAGSLEAAAAALAAARYDAVMLDLGLPDGDGLALVRALRQSQGGVPVIAVTARDGVDDRVRGLNGGADDYLVKPFALTELVARLRALLRRGPAVLEQRICLGRLSFDTGSGEAFVGDAPLGLARRERAVLELLMRRAGRVVRREVLENGVYGYDDAVGTNALEAQISRLRRRLAEAGADVAIHGVRGVGYLLTVAP